MIWSGKGIFTIMIFAGCLGLTQEIYKSVSGLAYIDLNQYIYLSISCGLAAVGNYFLVRHIESKPKRNLIDKDTGEEFTLSDGGSVFFIPMQWWTYLFGAGALVFVILLLFAA